MSANAKHQAAELARDELVAQLRIEIHAQLDRLVEANDKLEDLFDTRQSTGLGFMTAEAKELANRQVALDRAAAQGRLSQTTRTSVLGLRWLSGSGTPVPGVHEAPVTMPAVSESAEILAALQQHVRRLTRAAAAAAAAEIPGSRGRPPTGLPTTVGDVDVMVEQLRVLVDVYTNRPGLQALLRDLEHLERKALEVVDPSKSNHPDPCPWCGRKSLAVYGARPGRAAITVVCEGRHPCRCDDEWCPCQRNPIKHRHEWVNSGSARDTIDGRSPHSLVNLIAARKENDLMEAKAQRALEQIRQLHQPYWVDAEGRQHNHYVFTDEPPADHICTVDGIDSCMPPDEHLVPACVECQQTTADGDPGFPIWPCRTYQATDFTQTAGEHADSPNPEENQ